MKIMGTTMVMMVMIMMMILRMMAMEMMMAKQELELRARLTQSSLHHCPPMMLNFSRMMMTMMM